MSQEVPLDHRQSTYCTDFGSGRLGSGCARRFGMGRCEESEAGKIEAFRSRPHPDELEYL